MRPLATLMMVCALAGCGREPAAAPRTVKSSATAVEAPKFTEMAPGLSSHTIVLTYHDVVLSRDRNSVWFDCTVQELEDQLSWLEGKGARFISIQDLYERLAKGKEMPGGSVLVTFADNYLGFYKHALPILRRKKIPSVMFVHTGFVGSARGRPKMSWNQLQELDREGLVVIGSQTVSHPADLAKLPSAALKTEMLESKAALERQLGHVVRYLAYPNGKFDKRAMDAARAAGYEMAFSEEQRPAEESPSILAVNRYVHTKLKAAWKDLRRTLR
jgi:peptidoglycan/xylan/chitin deacetylase (PgdA/CDA1 family)